MPKLFRTFYRITFQCQCGSKQYVRTFATREEILADFPCPLCSGLCSIVSTKFIRRALPTNEITIQQQSDIRLFGATKRRETGV